MAAQYLQIYFLGLPFLFMYNVLSAMFNALGKSRIPLYFLIFSSVFNVVLDIIMVTKMDMGVAGVAWATLIAQGISAVLSFAVLIKNLNGLEGKQKTLFDTMELSEMTRIAIPSILQQSTVSIGMMLVQSVVNGFGSEALAGFSAAMRIESICVCLLYTSAMRIKQEEASIQYHQQAIARMQLAERDMDQAEKYEGKYTFKNFPTAYKLGICESLLEGLKQWFAMSSTIEGLDMTYFYTCLLYTSRCV